jgi:hypothetical protein
VKTFAVIAYTFCALAILVAMTACNPYLHADSPAPPGRAARIDPVRNFWEVVKYYRMEVSPGVAMALTCEYGAPCEHVHVRSEDPAVADIRLASLSVLKPLAYGTGHEEQTASAVVVVGKAPGSTWLHLTSREGHRDVLVTVVASPPPVTPQMIGAPTDGGAPTGAK